MKAELSAATRGNLPSSAFACPETRKYPHHHADGSLDLAHLRNALARIADRSNDQCGKGHLMAHARSEGMGAAKAEVLDDVEMAGWFEGKRPRRLLAIPFGGPIPSPHYAKGMDLDGEFFTPKTDVMPELFPVKPTFWHHGDDTFVGPVVIGKAENPMMDEDGWWVDQWLKAGERRVGLVRALSEKGAQLFGSSQPLSRGVKIAKTGEILRWPWAEQTLSTSPQNTLAAFRPAKALLADFDSAEIELAAPLRSLLSRLDDLSADLDPTSERGEGTAKAGRVYSARNLADFDAALEELEQVLQRIRGVTDRGRA
jgi:hypothetical protein